MEDAAKRGYDQHWSCMCDVLFLVAYAKSVFEGQRFAEWQQSWDKNNKIVNLLVLVSYPLYLESVTMTVDCLLKINTTIFIYLIFIEEFLWFVKKRGEIL